jgi:hypothetical protein
MENIAEIIVSVLVVVSLVGNALPQDNRAGKILRAISADAQALLAALRKK